MMRRYLVETSLSLGVMSHGSYGSLPQDGGLTSGLARPSPLALATRLQASCNKKSNKKSNFWINEPTSISPDYIPF